jgi:hypothetical protein
MDFPVIPFPLLSFFLGILYLNNDYTSDGQYKEHNNNNAKNNNGENNQDVNPLPPPPPTLEQVLAM